MPNGYNKRDHKVFVFVMWIIFIFGIVVVAGKITNYFSSKKVENKTKYDLGYVDGYSDGIHEKRKQWLCKKVTACNEFTDWRYAKPEDECVYKMLEMLSVDNPLPVSAGYGQYCTEIKQ